MANAKKAVENASQNNEEVLVKVKSSLEEGFANLKKTVGFDSAPEFIKETVNAQESLAKNWFDSLIRVAQVKSVEELNEVLMSQVKHFQKNITTAMDAEYWKQEGKEAKDYVSADFAKETIIKVIDLCQPAK
jgi:isoleucyl-tRNA synthetase